MLQSSRTDKSFIENYYAQRAPQFARKIIVFAKRQKKGAFDKIRSWAKFVQSYSKIRVIAVIRSRLEKQAKQLFFSRMHRYLLKRNNKGGADK